MSDDNDVGIEAAGINMKITYELLENATDKLMNLDLKVQEKIKLFLKNISEKVKQNKRKGSSLNYGLDDSWKQFKEAIKYQDEKLKICQETYNKIDIQVNKFDELLQKYSDGKEEAKNSENLLRRLAILKGRRKKKANRRRPQPKSNDIIEPITAKEDYNVDPSEPRYCYCNRVAFGRMVACDGIGCQYEWFHFDCVGLKEDPDNDWYCESCLAQKLLKEKKQKTSQQKVKIKKQNQHNNTLSPVKIKPVKRRKLLFVESPVNFDMTTPKKLNKNIFQTPERRKNLEKDKESSPRKNESKSTEKSIKKKRNLTKSLVLASSDIPTPNKKRKIDTITPKESPSKSKKISISPSKSSKKLNDSKSPNKSNKNSPKKLTSSRKPATSTPKKSRFSNILRKR